MKSDYKANMEETLENFKRWWNNEKWWQLTKNLTDKIGSFGLGKFFTTITDLNGSLNNLASLRGNQSLLTDLIVNPKKVKHACEKIVDTWLDCYEIICKITTQYQPGSITWMGIWFPGRGSDLQSDFSAMISPDIFQQYVIPDIKRQTEKLDQTLYHLDGPRQLGHAKHLLQIDELDGIQWVPGAGEQGVGSEKWFDLYENIQSHGKKLILHWMDKKKIKNVLKKLSHKDLLISTMVDSQDETDQIINDSKNWVR
ncbi:MAG: hypothetical protein K9N00_00650 [Candidatus Marinimicrobia bacterium]|nr:hypothetical protein [Candidatus Neomarinimicrobiota bacterium]